MPDISMCKNENCESKKHCYRYTATPSQYMQAYMLFEGKVSKCDMYWKDEVAFKKIICKTKAGKVLYADTKIAKKAKK